MNKSKHFLFFLGMASLTFTGCSTSDNFAEAAADDIPQLTEDEKWVLEANSDVEIKLGTGGNQAFTRAFVEGDESNLFETKRVSACSVWLHPKWTHQLQILTGLHMQAAMRVAI